MNKVFCIQNSYGFFFTSEVFEKTNKPVFANRLAMAVLFDSQKNAELTIKRNGLENVQVVLVTDEGEAA